MKKATVTVAFFVIEFFRFAFLLFYFFSDLAFAAVLFFLRAGEIIAAGRLVAAASCHFDRVELAVLAFAVVFAMTNVTFNRIVFIHNSLL